MDHLNVYDLLLRSYAWHYRDRMCPVVETFGPRDPTAVEPVETPFDLAHRHAFANVNFPDEAWKSLFFASARQSYVNFATSRRVTSLARRAEAYLAYETVVRPRGHRTIRYYMNNWVLLE